MSTIELPILLVEHSTIMLKFHGKDQNSGQYLDGVNLGPVATNLPKITPSILAGALLRDGKKCGFNPRVGFFDGKTLPPPFVDQSISVLQNRGYAKFRRAIPYAGGKIYVYQCGKGLDTIESALRDFPIMGTTSNFAYESGLVLEDMEKYKEINPDGKIIVGGRYAMHNPKLFIAGGADAVVLGEGEEIAAKLVASLLEGRQDIPGVVYNQNGSPIGLEQEMLRAPINNLPLPHFFKDSEILRSDLPGGQLSYYVRSQDGPLPEGVFSPVYFWLTSRGCIFRCPYCTTAGMRYDYMALDTINNYLRHLHQHGVKTLISSEDAFLERVLVMDRDHGREMIIAIMEMIRGYGFAIEWANGININTLYDKSKKEIDMDLLDAVFQNSIVGGHLIGTYRMLAPVERPGGDEELTKLVSPAIQLEIITQIVKRHKVRQGITWIIRPEDTRDQLEVMKSSAMQILMGIDEVSDGKKLSRLGVFFLTPHSGTEDEKTYGQDMVYDSKEYPELLQYFSPSVDGTRFGGMSYTEQFWYRPETLQELDPDSYQSWMTHGGYAR
jgi:radical SAM superfamily enzyme YgiQ (UPF0313 family)